MTLMKMVKTRISFSTLSILSALALSLAACAHSTISTPSKEVSAIPPQRDLDVETGSDPLKTISDRLDTIHTPKVLIATEDLKALVQYEKKRRQACRAANGKLEALKNIDLEGSP